MSRKIRENLKIKWIKFGSIPIFVTNLSQVSEVRRPQSKEEEKKKVLILLLIRININILISSSEAYTTKVKLENNFWWQESKSYLSNQIYHKTWIFYSLYKILIHIFEKYKPNDAKAVTIKEPIHNENHFINWKVYLN